MKVELGREEFVKKFVKGSIRNSYECDSMFVITSMANGIREEKIATSLYT